ncbi:MAG: tetratricopeptide repeat protein [Phycisphaerales bacterium]|nr:MAG: tetratricopeptide repeat protein [Phycisphaerales bacterium]
MLDRPAWSFQQKIKSSAWLVAVALLVLHAALAIGATLRMSPTFDEVEHLMAGYSYLQTGDYRLVPENPPLAELWAALPLLCTDADFPNLNNESWWTSNPWALGEALLFELGNDPDTLLVMGRSMIVLLSVVLGLVVFVWSSKLFGPVGGFLSLILYALSPTTLTHGSLMTSDTAAALMFLLALAGIWAVLHRVTIWRVLLGGLAVAGLALSKFSCILLLPIVLILLTVRLARRKPLVVAIGHIRTVHSRTARLGTFCLVGLVQLLIIVAAIWVVFGLRFEAFKNAEPGRDRLANFGTAPPYESSWNYELRHVGQAADLIAWARDHRLLPEAYLYGLTYTINSARTREAFLHGERSTGGFRLFFPYAFLVKTPLPSLVLMLLAMGTALLPLLQSRDRSRRTSLQTSLYKTAPLWTLLAVYGLFAVFGHLNIGHRHLLPIYPVLFILCGVAAQLLTAGRRPARACIILLLCLYPLASLSQWPHHLAYFNILVGGPRHAHHHLVDSSLDWGQDLKRLAKRIEDYRRESESHNQGAQRGDDCVAYWGSVAPARYGIEAKALATPPPWDEPEVFPLRPGTYCISATFLHQVYLLPMSRWTPVLERTYQALRPHIDRIQAGEPIAATTLPGAQSNPLTELVLKLRFARLCASLRQRSPDEWVGRTIMIYKLDQSQIDEALFGPPVGEGPDRGEPLRDFARQLAAAGLTEAAIECCKDAIQLIPDDARTCLQLGNLYLQQGRLPHAEEQLRKATALAPKMAIAHAQLGRCLAQQGKTNEAVQAYQCALSIDPRDADTHADLGRELIIMNRKNGAVAEAREALHLRPGDPLLRLNLAEILLQSGNSLESIEQLTALVSDHPRHAPAHALLAKALTTVGQAQQGIAHYHEALRIEPGLARVRYELASLLLQQGNNEDALREYDLLVELDPESARAWLDRGFAFQAIGNTDEAAKSFARAVRLDPSLVGVLEMRGITIDANATDFGETQAKEPDTPTVEATIEQADRLFAVGKAAEAASLYEMGARKRPDDALIHFKLGKALAAARKHHEAIAAFEKVLALRPDIAEAHVEIGIVHVDMDDAESAIRRYDKAIEINPDLLAAHYNKGTALAHLERFDDAVAAMQRALKLAKDEDRPDLIRRIQSRIQQYQEQPRP